MRGVVKIGLQHKYCMVTITALVQHVPFCALIDLLYLASYRPFFLCKKG